MTPGPDIAIVQLSRKVSMRFARISGGEFRMGSRGYYPDEDPVHRVRITRDFYLGVTPVTQTQFAVWDSKHDNHFKNKPDHPAENLDWNQAMAFCEWMTGKFGTQGPAGFVAGLPTEAQWEYACRAGTVTEYYTGDGEASLSDAGWFGEEWESGSTHKVGLKLPNAFGLFDMHGNVFEWCRDAWDADAYKKRVDGVADPEVRPEDVTGEANPGRVFRGGSWNDTAGGCRSASRDGWDPGVRFRDQGFRVCLFPGPVTAAEAEAGPGRGGGARRQAEREPERAGPAGATDLARAVFPARSGRKRKS